jgi:hypothetical protein
MMIIPYYVRNLHKTPTENHRTPETEIKKPYEKKEKQAPPTSRKQIPNPKSKQPTYLLSNCAIPEHTKRSGWIDGSKSYASQEKGRSSKHPMLETHSLLHKESA